MNGTISTLVLMSMKFISVVGDGTIAGGNLIVSASDFTDDHGNAVTNFPTYSYYNLYINGMLQPNGVVTVSTAGVVILGGAALDLSDPIIVEFVLLQTIPPSTAVFTTGPILNSGQNQALTSTMLISNDDVATTATVELEVFEVTINASGTAKVGAAHQLFTVPPLSVATRTFNITGFPAYEVQFTVTVGANVVVDVFATDAAGNLNAAQRVLQSETTRIAALTPLP